MVVELSSHAYPLVQPLFGELGYHLSIAAVLAGGMPGRVFVDDAAGPRAALISSPEGCYLGGAGAPGGADLAAARAIFEALRAEGWQEIDLFLAPPWEPLADALFGGYAHLRVPRRHYALRALAGAWHRQVPPHLTLAMLDAATFARPDLREHHIQRWARNNWGSVEGFLARGFGAILFDGAQPASWCLADSSAGARCEVGIHTHPAYRRQGLATIAVAAAVDHALARGHAEVGWHCAEENRGSQGVAEKVGFQLTHRFPVFACRLAPAG